MLCVCHTPSVWTLLSSMCAGGVSWDGSRCCDHSDPKQTVRVHATDQFIVHTNAVAQEFRYGVMGGLVLMAYVQSPSDKHRIHLGWCEHLGMQLRGQSFTQIFDK